MLTQNVLCIVQVLANSYILMLLQYTMKSKEARMTVLVNTL